MANYLGDFAVDSTIDTKFTTVNSSGAPTTLAGTPVISAYEDNSLTQITAGITLTVDFDAVTGLHNVRVVATTANGYDAGSNYQLVITTGTVGGTSVVGYVVAEFSIQARSALRPTTAGRTLDVTATGEAGIDLDNTVGTLAKTTDITGFNDLSAAQVNAEVDAALDTAIPAVNVAGSVNDVLLDRVPAALVGGRMDSSVGAMAADVVTAAAVANGAIDAATFAAGAIDAAAIANGAIDAATFAAGAIDAAAIAANAIGASELATDAVAEIADAIWDEARSGHVTLGTFGDSYAGLVTGSAIAGTLSTTQMTTDLTEATDDHYNGRLIVFTSGVLTGQATDITDYTGATKLLTYTAITEAPAAGDDFVIF